jgi:hypothetical protein
MLVVSASGTLYEALSCVIPWDAVYKRVICETIIPY